MANRFARKSGNWNASDVWSDTPSGSASASFIPTTGDVAMANSFTVTVNVDANLGAMGEVRNDTTGGATAGGYFELNAGITLTANAFSGSTANQCIRTSYSAPSVAYLVGNVSCAGNNKVGAMVNGSGRLYITGTTHTGGTGNSQPAIYANAGPVTVVGDVYGGTSANAFGVWAQAGDSVVNGSVYGGSGSYAHGGYASSTGTLSISWDAVGGSGTNAHGVQNSAASSGVTVSGNAVGGSGPGVYGAHNNSTGVMSVGCAVGNDWGLGYSTNNSNPGVFGYGINTGTAQATTKVKSIRYGAKGQSPTAGLVQIDTSDLASSTAVFVEPTTFATRTFGPAENIGGQPAAADVRYGTAYNFGNTTGTCHVPAAASVLYGVPVDAATGAVTITAVDIRAALGLASANLDSQLDALPTASENATAVWGAATRTLTESTGGGATAEDVWTYATRSLTEAPDVPTVEEIAAEVRTELTPELSRVANCATVESTGDQLAGLL